MNKDTKQTQEIMTLRKAMAKALEEKRYEHTLGVAYTAASLAMCYGQDVYQAQVAGLLHDCAKNYTNEKRISICKKKWNSHKCRRTKESVPSPCKGRQLSCPGEIRCQ